MDSLGKKAMASPRKETRLIARQAQALAMCQAEARAYAICVSSKGVAISQHECQRQFSQILACMAKNNAARRQ